MVHSKLQTSSISVIIPTIGRPDSLRRVLQSLVDQTVSVAEVIVADGSGGGEVAQVVTDRCWADAGLEVRSILVFPPNAVRQRRTAIEASGGELLLLLDDDVVLERKCAEEMTVLLNSDPDLVAVTADFNNQKWSGPTRVWRLYLRYVLRIPEGGWQGQVVGPLLRFGYDPVPSTPLTMRWLGTGNSLIRRQAYDQSGGFSDFFLHRCTMNEDVDLGLKLSRQGSILFCPQARMGHFHAPGGRVPSDVAAEDDLYNRFFVLRRTLGLTVPRALRLVGLFFGIETLSNFSGCVRRADFTGFFAPFKGRTRALRRVFQHLARESSRG